MRPSGHEHQTGDTNHAGAAIPTSDITSTDHDITSTDLGADTDVSRTHHHKHPADIDVSRNHHKHPADTDVSRNHHKHPANANISRTDEHTVGGYDHRRQ